jgi:hypothetical protein
MVRRFNRLLLLLVPSAWLFAQPDLATLRGRITDPNGAGVQGIRMLLFENGKEFAVRQVTTSASGDYTAPMLRPATYTAKIDAVHYQTLQIDNITLQAGQVRYFDVELKVEARDETLMQDEAGKPLLTQTGTVAGLVDLKRLWQDTPYVDLHPSMLPLATLAPGVQGNGSGSQASVVVSGVSRRSQQSWGIDGVTFDAANVAANPALMETMEAIIANPGLEVAKPVRIEAISRHGIDGLHGLASFKRESSALNSKEYFDTAKARYKVSEAQGELSGALIPHWTYFYGGVMYQKTPYRQTLYADVPTTKMLAWDFTQFLSASTAPNGKVVAIRDPRNSAPFPGNLIPSNRISPVASRYISNYYPTYNLGDADTLTRNYTWVHPNGSESYSGNWPFGRIDQRISNNHQVYFHFLQDQTASVVPGSVGEQLNATQSARYRSVSGSEVGTFNANTINQFSIAHTGVVIKQGEAEQKINPMSGSSAISTLGLIGTNPNGFGTQGFPAVSITGMTGLSMAFGGGKDKNTAAKDSINTVQDILIWSKGRHSVKFGAQYQSYHWLQGEVPLDVFGAFSFTGGFTGLGFADFVLGIPSTSTREAGRVGRALHQTQTGIFLGDTFRVNRRFMFEYGVRWDYYSTPVYNDGYMSNWNPANNQVIVAPGTLTDVSTFFPKAATVVLGKVVPSAKTTNFRPRIGGAYQLTNRFVLRGGYSEYTENEGYGVAGRLSSNNPYSLTETYTNSVTNGVVALSFPKPFPTTPSSSLLPGQDITALPTKTDEGVIRQFNATLDASLFGFSLRAGYVGSRGANMNYTLDINKPKASGITFVNSRKPYPLWASAYETRTDGKWKYDSAVANAQRSFGLVSFIGSFTWAKNTSNYANTVDPYNVTNVWTNDAATRQRYFSGAVVLPIPVGKGHTLGADASPWMSRVISEWQLQLLGTVASGQYYSPYFTGADPANASSGFVTQLADCVGDPNSGARTLSRWFNPSAFSTPSASAGRYGNCAMNSLEGYPIHVAHASATKALSFGPAIKLVFTAQVSNVLNTPHFTIPNNNISTPSAGAFTASSLANYSTTERLGARQIDFKLRLVW